MNIFQTEQLEILVQADVLFTLVGFPVTNTVVTALLVTLLLFAIVCYVNVSGFQMRSPGKLQVALEMIVEAMYEFTEKLVGSRQMAARIFPIIATLFLYIAFLNLLLSFVPLLDSFRYDGSPIFRVPTSDFNVTLSMALAMVVLAHFYSIRRKNPIGYLGQYFRILPVIRGFRKGIGDGFVALIEAFVGLLDIISEFAKVASLSLRLFGNMFAGIVVLAVVMSLFAVLLPIPLIILNLLVGLLQAIVFGALVSSYLMMAMQD